MTYWTVMLITVLSGPYEGLVTGLLYESKTECLSHVKQVTSTLDYDYKVECKESEEPSGSIKPQPKP